MKRNAERFDAMKKQREREEARAKRNRINCCHCCCQRSRRRTVVRIFSGWTLSVRCSQLILSTHCRHTIHIGKHRTESIELHPSMAGDVWQRRQTCVKIDFIWVARALARIDIMPSKVHKQHSLSPSHTHTRPSLCSNFFIHVQCSCLHASHRQYQIHISEESDTCGR